MLNLTEGLVMTGPGLKQVRWFQGISEEGQKGEESP